MDVCKSTCHSNSDCVGFTYIQKGDGGVCNPNNSCCILYKTWDTAQNNYCVPAEVRCGPSDPYCWQLYRKVDCAGTPGGSAVVDACGVCNGDGSSCAYTTPIALTSYNCFAPAESFPAMMDDTTMDVCKSTCHSNSDCVGFTYIQKGDGGVCNPNNSCCILYKTWDTAQNNYCVPAEVRCGPSDPYCWQLYRKETTTTLPPTSTPTKSPSESPTKSPSESPTKSPSKSPTESPSKSPSQSPSSAPTTSIPTKSPSKSPSRNPSKSPTKSPSRSPSQSPSRSPSSAPTAESFLLKVDGFHGSPDDALSDAAKTQKRVVVDRVNYVLRRLKDGEQQ